jgi:hypothetical protein
MHIDIHYNYETNDFDKKSDKKIKINYQLNVFNNYDYILDDECTNFTMAIHLGALSTPYHM